MRRSATGAMDVADNAAVPSGESTIQVPMRKLSDEQWQSLASGLAREIARLGLGPDWTEHNTHDPGITVLELLTYALTDLQYRSSTLDANGRALARRVAQLAESLATATDADDCPPGMQRVNFFPGLLLSADDLTAETSYVRDKAFTATLSPTTDDTAVALARVNFSQGHWMLDRDFSIASVRV